MSEVIQIADEDALLKFIADIDHLHDALLHEAVLLHPGYVTREGWMFGDSELPNARLFFHSQFADVALVEVSLRRVSRFRLEPKYEFRLEGEVDRGEIVLYLCGKHHSPVCEIRSAEAEYRLHGRDLLGPQYILARVEQQ